MCKTLYSTDMLKLKNSLSAENIQKYAYQNKSFIETNVHACINSFFLKAGTLLVSKNICPTALNIFLSNLENAPQLTQF